MLGLIGSSVAAHAQANRIQGRIVAAQVSGTVTALNRADNTSTALAAGVEIKQNYVIQAGAGSSAVLVFSNGTSVAIAEDTMLAIDEFLQEPFSGENVVAQAKAEPSTSTTKLNVLRGELVANVKKLNRDKGSKFEVLTPIGAAGVRGTVFRIVVRADANGQVTFSLATSEGEVLLAGLDGSNIPVQAGKEVTVEFNAIVDENGNISTTFFRVPAGAAKDISGDAKSAIVNSISAVETALENLTLTLSPDTETVQSAVDPSNPNRNQNRNDDINERPNSPIR
ncbi:MAG: FecR domain-containing protein [Opitutus sp.]|nr:FecR domain-containing protein [Opitutus sp.]